LNPSMISSFTLHLTITIEVLDVYFHLVMTLFIFQGSRVTTSGL